MGRNRTVPHAVSAADRPRALQTTSTHNVDRRQHVQNNTDPLGGPVIIHAGY